MNLMTLEPVIFVKLIPSLSFRVMKMGAQCAANTSWPWQRPASGSKPRPPSLSRTPYHRPPGWPSGKASASRAEDPGFESRLRQDFFGVESYQ